MIQTKWHLLSPENYNKIFDVLSQEYPKLFIKDQVLILKKRLHRDIFNDGRSNLSRTVIRKFLTLYSRQSKYRQIHIENTVRYDLNGNKAGIVTKEDVGFIYKNTLITKKQIAHKKSKGQEQNFNDKINKENKFNNKSSTLKSINSNDNKPKLGIKV